MIDTAKVDAMRLLKKLVDRREELQELEYICQERGAYVWSDICEAKREEVVDIINMVTEMVEEDIDRRPVTGMAIDVIAWKEPSEPWEGEK